MKKAIEIIKKNPDKAMYFVTFIFVLLTMIPVWYLGRYDVPSLDDYGFGSAAHHAYIESGSVLAAIKAAAEYVKFYFYAKQATYSSVFLMCLFPGFISEKFYFVTPLIMTAMLIGSISALVHVILKDCIGMTNRYCVGTVNLLIIFISVQTMIAPLEGIYWYNGSTHYVFMQSVMYFEIALLLHYLNCEKKGTRTVILIVASLLGIVVGGGNLITGLQACILAMLYILILILQIVISKKPECFFAKLGFNGNFEKNKLPVLIPIAVTIIGYLINITAPGNSLRQTVEVQMNPIKAVILSFEWGAIYGISWIKPIAIAGFVAIAVILWKEKSNENKSYINPALMAFISYCVFSAMLTPTFYATSLDAPNRVKNIIGTALQLLIFINIVNGFGYLKSKQNVATSEKSVIKNVMDQVNKKPMQVASFFVAVMILIFIFPQNKNEYTSMSAVRSLLNGEAARYYSESMERIEKYNSTDADIEINAISDNARPYLLFKQDVTGEGDEGWWQNIQLCNYYDKNSITVNK